MCVVMVRKKRYRVLLFATQVWMLCVAALYLCHPDRFALNNYEVTVLSQVPNELVVLNNTFGKHVCPIMPTGGDVLQWTMRKYIEEPIIADTSVLVNELSVQPGGIWEPPTCTSQLKVTVVIAYRDRESHLKIFLQYIHHFLQKQQIGYRIILVEQSWNGPWNKGRLLNIGFVEGEMSSSYPCYIFHDVDLIPESLSNIYSCTRKPRHMSANLDLFRYNLLYKGLFGGVVSLTREQFQDINGYSNVYYGWGGEDDDFWNRLDHKGYQVTRFEPSVSRYTALAHSKSKPSKERYFFLHSGKERFDTDGLKDLNYSVISKELRPLYTWIYVDV